MLRCKLSRVSKVGLRNVWVCGSAVLEEGRWFAGMVVFMEGRRPNMKAGVCISESLVNVSVELQLVSCGEVGRSRVGWSE